MDNKNRMNSSQISTSHTEWITFVISQINIFRRNQKYCDLLLEVNGKTHNAHRNVLASWSSILDSHLSERNLLSSPCAVLKINFNGDDSVFADFLDFIYTGLIDLREDNFLSLLHLACSFEILLLKGYCENFLKNNLHLGNLLSTYLLSRRYHLQYVEEVAVKFLQTNLSDIVKQPEFLSLSPGKLNAILSGSCMQQLKPEIKLFLIISWVGFDVKNRELFLVVLLQHIHWSSVAADFLVEISQTDNFFTSNESSLYLLLQTLNSSKIGLGPYKDDFPILHSLYSHLMHDVFHLSTLPVEIENFTTAEVQAYCNDQYCNNSAQKQCATTQTDDVYSDNGASFSCVREQPFPCNHEKELQQAAGVPVVPVEPSNIMNTLESNLAEHYSISNGSAGYSPPPLRNTDERVLALSPSLNSLHDENLQPMNNNSSLTTDCDNSKQNTPSKRSKKGKANSSIQEGGDNHLIPAKNSTINEKEPVHTCTNNSNGSAVVDKELIVDTFQTDTQNTAPNQCTPVASERAVPSSEEQGKNQGTDDAQANAKKPKKSERSDKNNSEKQTVDHAPSVTKAESKKKKTKEQKKTDPTEKKCPECDYEAHTIKRLRNHVMRYHQHSKFQYKCNLCDFESKWSRNYSSHMKTHFPGPEYRCDYSNCDYFHNSLQNLLRHRAKHSNDRPFGCDLCSMRFRTITNLAAHKRFHSEDRPFHCEQCDKTFRTRSTLQQHQATHSNSRPFLCDICGFSAKYQTQLSNHQRIHSGDIIRCEVASCTYTTPRKTDMKYHMRSHLGIREFRCKTCGIEFIEKGHLLRHEKSHLAVKPYKCQHCEYESSRIDKYTEHVWRHHGEKPEKKNKDQREEVQGAKMPYKPRKSRGNKASNNKTDKNRKIQEINNFSCEDNGKPSQDSASPVPEPLLKDHSMKAENEYVKVYTCHNWKFTVDGSTDSYPSIEANGGTHPNPTNMHQYMDLQHTPVLQTPELQTQPYTPHNATSAPVDQHQIHQSYVLDPMHKVHPSSLMHDDRDKDGSHKTHQISDVHSYQTATPVASAEDSITLQRLYDMAPQYQVDHSSPIDQLYAGSHSVNATYHASTTDSQTYQTAQQHLPDNFQVPQTSSVSSSDYSGLNAFMSLF